MNYSMQKVNELSGMKRIQGLTLLEVLLAMVIFAIGMLALAHLQTNLTRSSTDANTRTVATNIGEEILENLRAFQRISSDPANLLFAYADIDNAFVAQSITRGGLNYTVSGTVSGYDFQADNTTLNAPVTAVIGVVYDFKVVDLTVTWDNNPQFQIDEGQQISNADMGSGNITISGLISSIHSLGAAKVSSGHTEDLGAPPVNYTPGLNPDIVSIDLGNKKFKESTIPVPEVIRSGDQVETWFDVITYSQSAPGAEVFLRREEFVSITCECEISGPSGSGEDGFDPTLWTGTEYSAAPFVAKTHGASTNNGQSQYCSTCCRDHHDTSAGNDTADTRFHSKGIAGGYLDSSSPFAGDHPHYIRDDSGDPTQVTTAGDTYVEACRLIRKDGFFRVAQEFSLESLNGFPEDFLNESAEIEVYSEWVTSAVTQHYNSGTSPLTGPTTPFPGDTTSPTNLPTPTSAISQQLRSRGIYTDNLSAEAQIIVDCMANGGAIGDGNNISGDNCEAPGAQTILEILPFFDVQTTFLARWTESEPDNPVDATNEELKSNNGHSRGKASLAGGEIGKSIVHNKIETGNIGLIGTVSIGGSNQFSEADVHITATGSDVPPLPSGNPAVSGSITAQGGTSDAAIVSVSGADASCTKPTNSTFFCEITGGSPTLTISNYYSSKFILVACSAELGPGVITIGTSFLTNRTVFQLPAATTAGIVITIKKNSC